MAIKHLRYFLTRYPCFLPLIPIFFVLHGFLENFGFITVNEALLLAGIYCLGTAIVFILFHLYYRNPIKASLMAAFIMMVYLFFGAGLDFLLSHIPFMGKYSVVMTLLLVLFFFLLFRLKKAVALQRPMLLLNLIFIVFVLVDLAGVTARFIHPTANKLAALPVANSYRPLPPQTEKPDIWFLIFDEYASSLSLQEQYGYHNNLDAWLEEKGFKVNPKSYSNYPYTLASAASILNMSYLGGLKDVTTITGKEMNYCLGLIKNNETIKFLSAQGYEIANCSPFDLAGHPARAEETLLPIKTKLITSNTMYNRVMKDMLWIFFKTPLKKWFNDRTHGTGRVNDRLLQLLHAQTTRKEGHPLFVYGHIYMPHAPFFTDSSGRPRSMAEVLDSVQTPADYLSYLAYTNTQIKQLITGIQAHTGGKAVIVLMGDHGFRLHTRQNLRQNYQNLNAVYLPDHDYHLFYDSITCVNQFRVLFNTLFHQSLPLVKDSTHFLIGL